MLKFLATTANIRKIRSEDSNFNSRKVVTNSSGKSLFAISRHNSNESRAVSFLAEDGKQSRVERK